MKRMVMLMVCCALVMPAVPAGAADGSWDRVRQAGRLVLGLDASFPLMGFRDGEGRLAGFDIDLATEAGRRLGVTVEWRPVPWDGIVYALNGGTFDAVWNGMTITDERAQLVAFTRPYLMGGQAAAVRRDDRTRRRLADLAGARVGVVSGGPGSRLLEGLPTAPEAAVEYPDLTAALAGLAAGEVAAVAADVMPLRDALAKQAGRFRLLPGLVRREPFGVAFRAGDRDLRDRVQKALDGLRKDGTMAKLSRRWFGEDLTNPKKW